MAKQESVIRLLQVEDSLEDAESIVSALRNGGIAVRAIRPESVEELTEALGKQPVDVVVAAWQARSLPFDAVAQAVKRSKRPLGLVASSTRIDEEILLGAAAAGAHHVVLRSRPEQILSTLKHVWTAVEAVLSQQRLQEALRELGVEPGDRCVA